MTWNRSSADSERSVCEASSPRTTSELNSCRPCPDAEPSEPELDVPLVSNKGCGMVLLQRTWENHQVIAIVVRVERC
jgi:hypothetical protein